MQHVKHQLSNIKEKGNFHSSQNQFTSPHLASQPLGGSNNSTMPQNMGISRGQTPIQHNSQLGMYF